jgi:large subunit ribosomal protein L33
MRVSLSWLRELVQVDDSVDDLAERLSMAGFEVEDVDDLSARARGVVVGHVLTREKHPNADKLRNSIFEDSRDQRGKIFVCHSLRTCGATSFMAKNKGVRIVVTLECTECRSASASEKRSPGVSRYTTEKNRRNTTERLEIMKFCPQLNKMTLHKEIK